MHSNDENIDFLLEKFEAMSSEEKFNVTFRHPVTGLLNDTAFQIFEKNRRLEGHVYSAIELEYLKWVNEEYQDIRGDEFLKRFAAAFAKVGIDYVFHLHGDRFCAIFDSRAEADAKMARLHEEVKHLPVYAQPGVVTRHPKSFISKNAVLIENARYYQFYFVEGVEGGKDTLEISSHSYHPPSLALTRNELKYFLEVMEKWSPETKEFLLGELEKEKHDIVTTTEIMMARHGRENVRLMFGEQEEGKH